MSFLKCFLVHYDWFDEFRTGVVTQSFFGGFHRWREQYWFTVSACWAPVNINFFKLIVILNTKIRNSLTYVVGFCLYMIDILLKLYWKLHYFVFSKNCVVLFWIENSWRNGGFVIIHDYKYKQTINVGHMLTFVRLWFVVKWPNFWIILCIYNINMNWNRARNVCINESVSENE